MSLLLSLYRYLIGAEDQFKVESCFNANVFREQGKHHIVNPKEGDEKQCGFCESPRKKQSSNQGLTIHSALYLVTGGKCSPSPCTLGNLSKLLGKHRNKILPLSFRHVADGSSAPSAARQASLPGHFPCSCKSGPRLQLATPTTQKWDPVFPYYHSLCTTSKRHTVPNSWAQWALNGCNLSLPGSASHHE